MRGLLSFSAMTVLSLLLTAGCSVGSNNSNLSGSGCTVSATAAANSSVAQISISCTGGSAPYTVTSMSIGGRTPDSISGSYSSFSGSTLLSATDSAMTNLVGVSGSLTIADSSSTSASYTFNILSSGGTTSSIACTLTPSTAAPATGSTVVYTVVPTSGWGTAPYIVNSFIPGNGGVVVGTIPTASSSVPVVQATYSIAGSATPSVTMQDASGKTGSCSTVVTIGGGSSALTCSLYQTNLSNGQISLQATSSTGAALTIYSVTATPDGSVVSTGNPTVVSFATAGSKNVTAIAYSSAGVPCNTNGQVTLALTAPTSSSSFTCTVTQTTDMYNNISFSATSSNGHPLAFANFNAGANGTVYGSGNPIYASYSVAGMKTASTQIYDTTTNQFCNNGSPMSQSFYAYASTNPYGGSGGGVGSGGPLSCSVVLSANPVYRGQVVAAAMYASGGTGTVALQSISAVAGSGVSGQFTDLTHANLSFAYSGLVTLTFVARDSASPYNNTASCPVTVQVY